MKSIIATAIMTIMITAVETASFAEPYHATSKTVDYKCIFNHELLIISHKKENSSQYIASFIEKLEDTDVREGFFYLLPHE